MITTTTTAEARELAAHSPIAGICLLDLANQMDALTAERDRLATAVSVAAVVQKDRDTLRARVAELTDDPELDGTDGAHPAWWRGHVQSCAVLCKKVNEILDGKDDGHGVSNEPWESTRRRLLAMAQTSGKPAAWIEPGHLTEVTALAEKAGHSMTLIASTGKNTPHKMALFTSPARPMSDEQVTHGFASGLGSQKPIPSYDVWVAAVRWAEEHIKGEVK